MFLIDQPARTRIEQRLDETLFVEAGAGTGKTHELVQRIINLIVSGNVQANKIAAITFTEKAAAELYDRVLEELDQQREQATDPQRQRVLAEATTQLDQAAIETLHAFAGRILRLHPIAAGLPPGYRILDESEGSLKFAERWQRALDELLEDPELADPLLTAFDAGIELKHLEEIAKVMHEDWDRAEQKEAELEVEEVDIEPFIAGLNSVARLKSKCRNVEDTMFQRLARVEAYAIRLEKNLDHPGKLTRLLIPRTETSLKGGRDGNNMNWPKGKHLEARERLKALDEQREELRHQLVLSCCAPICNAIRKIVVQYADERRKAGELEFHDLLIRASKLLKEKPSVAESVRRRYQRLLIDEFQDNDPMQTRIIDAITQGEPGRAFYVGDPKQSIYRFRRADIEQFNKVKKKKADGLTRLTQNFRSTPGVIEFVNHVFEPLMTEGAPDQADWENLNAHRDPIAGVEHAVTVVGEGYQRAVEITREQEGEGSPPTDDEIREQEGEESPITVEDIRELEGKGLARMIADITASKWQVFDKSIDGCRDARFADIAILVPTRTGYRKGIRPALDELDIPYRLESRSEIYGEPEIRVLLNLLRAIEDPTDQIALVAALRSPAFACADDDLYRWKQAGGRWDYWSFEPQQIPIDDPVADSMRWLRETAKGRWEMSISELVGYTIRERRLMELAVAERQPREHWARYRFLLDQARAFCDGGGSTLSEFLTWAEYQAKNDTQVIESVVPEEDQDAVRIMTIHAAKGLEFPIVVFAGLNSLPLSTAPALLWSGEKCPEESDCTDESDSPEESDCTDESDSPEESDCTDESDNPEESDCTDESDNPEESDCTDESDNPEESDCTDESDNPEESDCTDESDSPEESECPDCPHEPRRPEVRFAKHLETPGFAKLWEREEKLQRDEYVRRNYVGATRARDHLILSVYHKTTKEDAKSKTDAQVIDTVIKEENVSCRRLTHDEIPDPPQMERENDLTAGDETADERQRWIIEREAAIQRFGKQPHETVTSASGRNRRAAPRTSSNPRDESNVDQSGDRPPWRRGRAATALGRATHAVLQVVDLKDPDPEQIRQEARAQAAAESLEGKAAEQIERLVLNATESEVVQDAVSAGRYWRELYVSAEIEGVQVDGFIDLLFQQTNGKLVVVDYKTDTLRSDEAYDEAVARFRKQAALYALILEESLKMEVDSCVLLFLQPNKEELVPRLDVAKHEVRQQLAASSVDGGLFGSD